MNWPLGFAFLEEVFMNSLLNVAGKHRNTHSPSSDLGSLFASFVQTCSRGLKKQKKLHEVENLLEWQGFGGDLNPSLSKNVMVETFLGRSTITFRQRLFPLETTKPCRL